MTERYNPPKEAVDKLVRERSSKDLAIAYLRASRRARIAEESFRLLDLAANAKDDAREGDFRETTRKLTEMTRILKRMKQTT